MKNELFLGITNWQWLAIIVSIIVLFELLVYIGSHKARALRKHPDYKRGQIAAKQDLKSPYIGYAEAIDSAKQMLRGPCTPYTYGYVCYIKKTQYHPIPKPWN